jgi:transcriptional pleiotropic regulator of transition state genes
MKATGIIRKMDSLGRLVVPKEFRRKMGADDGTEFEIYTDGVDTICFKKVAPEADEINWEKLFNVVECILGEGVEFALYDENGVLQTFVGDYPLSVGDCAQVSTVANGKVSLATPATAEAITAWAVLDNLFR